MLNLLVVGALSFSAPPSCARRDVLRFGAGSVVAAGFTVLQSPLPAHAEYFGEPPPKLTAAQYKEKLEQAKEYKCVTPSEWRPLAFYCARLSLPRLSRNTPSIQSLLCLSSHRSAHAHSLQIRCTASRRQRVARIQGGRGAASRRCEPSRRGWQAEGGVGRRDHGAPWPEDLPVREMQPTDLRACRRCSASLGCVRGACMEQTIESGEADHL